MAGGGDFKNIVDWWGGVVLIVERGGFLKMLHSQISGEVVKKTLHIANNFKFCHENYSQTMEFAMKMIN